MAVARSSRGTSLLRPTTVDQETFADGGTGRHDYASAMLRRRWPSPAARDPFGADSRDAADNDLPAVPARVARRRNGQLSHSQLRHAGRRAGRSADACERTAGSTGPTVARRLGPRRLELPSATWCCTPPTRPTCAKSAAADAIRWRRRWWIAKAAASCYGASTCGPRTPTGRPRPCRTSWRTSCWPTVLFGEALPRWLDEGMAILADPRDKRQQHQRELERAVARGSQFRVAELLCAGRLSAGRRLGNVLRPERFAGRVSRRPAGPRAVRRIRRAVAGRTATTHALRHVYRFGIGELERRWHAKLTAPSATASRESPAEPPAPNRAVSSVRRLVRRS